MPSSAAIASPRFHCIVARAANEAAAELALAEAVAVGASGAEQRDEPGGVTLLLYAPEPVAAAVVRAVARVLGKGCVGASTPLEPQDWPETWKVGLRPLEVSPRLRVRPSFDASLPGPAQRDLVIDPGQAFGTGGHESTQLALAWIDALRGELGSRVLDAGTGTGVLALAALLLGAHRAVAFDLDPVAAQVARANALANGLAARFDVWAGPIDALAPGARFEGIVANMLQQELEPLIGPLALHIQRTGWIVISGLLESEIETWAALGAGAGLRVVGARSARDPSGTVWSALLMRPRRR